MVITKTHVILKLVKCSRIHVFRIPDCYGPDAAIYLKDEIPDILDAHFAKGIARKGHAEAIEEEARFVEELVTLSSPAEQAAADDTENEDERATSREVVPPC